MEVGEGMELEPQRVRTATVDARLRSDLPSHLHPLSSADHTIPMLAGKGLRDTNFTDPPEVLRDFASRIT
jgi:hypothetical protein